MDFHLIVSSVQVFTTNPGQFSLSLTLTEPLTTCKTSSACSVSMSRTSGGDGLNPPSSCGGEVVTLLSSSPSHSNTLSSYSYSHRYSHHALSVCDDVTYFAFPACTCVAVESWGHFPHSKRRLVSLLTRLQPRGLACLEMCTMVKFRTLCLLKLKL